MRYPAAETSEKHSRILAEASKLFRERGFAGVSVAEVMKSARLTHGPFYNHFASKEALIEECLRKRIDESLGEIDAAAEEKAGVVGFVENYLSREHCDDPGRGCLIAALSAEVGRTPWLQGLFTRLVGDSIDRYTAYLRWPARKRARGDSIRMLASMVGAVVLARAVDDEALSAEILEEVRAGIAPLN